MEPQGHFAVGGGALLAAQAGGAELQGRVVDDAGVRPGGQGVHIGRVERPGVQTLQRRLAVAGAGLRGQAQVVAVEGVVQVAPAAVGGGQRVRVRRRQQGTQRVAPLAAPAFQGGAAVGGQFDGLVGVLRRRRRARGGVLFGRPVAAGQGDRGGGDQDGGEAETADHDGALSDRIGQPSSRAWRSRVGSGSTATG